MTKVVFCPADVPFVFVLGSWATIRVHLGCSSTQKRGLLLLLLLLLLLFTDVHVYMHSSCSVEFLPGDA